MRPGDPHPDELSLCEYADGLLEGAERRVVEGHLTACDRCARIVGDLRDQEQPTTSPPSFLSPRFGTAAVPRVLMEAMTDRRVTTPSPGQLWRLEWQGRAALAVVLDESQNARAQVAPVATDPHLAGSRAIGVDTRNSPVGFAIALCSHITAEVPGFVLDCVLGDLQWAVQRSSAEPTVGGLPPSDPVRDYRAALAEVLAHFSAADWTPAPAHDEATLGELAERRGLAVDDIADALSIRVRDALALLRGQRDLEPAQAPVLAELLDIDEEDLPSGPPLPAQLVEELSRAERRPAVRARARRTGASEVDTYRRVARQAAIAPATRRHRTAGSKEHWRRVLDAILGQQR